MIKAFFKGIFGEPEMYVGKSGKPNGNFNSFQVWLYPEICKEHLEIALSHCPPEMAERQRRIIYAKFPQLM
jgi:hypothetical protein